MRAFGASFMTVRHPSTSLMLAASLALCVGGVQAKPSAKLTDKARAAETQAVFDCRRVSEDAARLACYDKAAGALDAAEAKGDVVVIDRAQAQAVRRQAFGFNLPSVSLFNRAIRDEAVDRVEVELSGAHQGGDGRWVMATTTDQVWRQTESDDLFPAPRTGSKMVIRRGAIGSYFCKVDGLGATRCARDH